MFPFTRRTVSDIKADFEAKKESAPLAAHSPLPRPSRTVALVNISAPRPPNKSYKPLQQSIDAVIDDAVSTIAPFSIRPSPLGSKQSSWIGPQPREPAPPRPVGAMTYQSTIHFSSPGLQPPVYIGTSLSDPPWQPIEMDQVTEPNGEYSFSKTFYAEEGEYQYKLRLGPGDWWVCDNTKPKVNDGAGNENNVHTVKPPTQRIESEHDIHTAPWMPHECNTLVDHRREVTGPVILEPVVEPEAASPLFRHESLAPPPCSQQEDSNDEPETPPLFRHETVSPTSHEQDHSPLFHHESMAIGNKHNGDPHQRIPSARKLSSFSVPEEADLSDPSLEQFPTDRRGIMEHLNRTPRPLHEDETHEDETSNEHSSSRLSLSDSAITTTSSFLPSVVEDGNEEKEAQQDELNHEERTNLTHEEDLRQVRISGPSDRPMAPMTPPLTPKEQDGKELDERADLSLHNAEDTEARVKGRAMGKATDVSKAGISPMAAVFACTVAVAAAIAVWYVKFKIDDIVI